MELAFAGHFELAALQFLQFQRQIGLQFLDEAILKLAAGGELAFAGGEGRSVGADGHMEGGLGQFGRRKRGSISTVSNGVADLGLANTGQSDNIAGKGFVCLVAGKAAGKLDGLNRIALVSA